MTAYVVFTRERTRDAAEMEIYAPAARAAGVGHNLKPLAFYGPNETLEGAPIEGAVIIEFPTFAEAKAWYDSPAYVAARAHRFAGADYRIFITEGL